MAGAPSQKSGDHKTGGIQRKEDYCRTQRKEEEGRAEEKGGKVERETETKCIIKWNHEFTPVLRNSSLRATMVSFDFFTEVKLTVLPVHKLQQA